MQIASLKLSQRLVIWLAAVSILLMCMYPPWTGSFQKVEGGRSFSHYIGYYFVLEPPRGDWRTVNTIVGATTFDKDDSCDLRLESIPH